MKLHEVMEDIGPSADMRLFKAEIGKFSEIMNTIFCNFIGDDNTIYQFGSAYEASATPGMLSDTDTVFVSNQLPVVFELERAPPGICLLSAYDDEPPGYTKLQLVANGIPLHSSPSLNLQNDQDIFSVSSDQKGRLVLSYDQSSKPKSCDERHGPAVTDNPSEGWTGQDRVVSMRSHYWPRCATEYLTRTRNYNWPSPAVLNTLKTLGCLFVQAGHPHGDEPNLQWRTSLSHQERFLITHFNSVQLKCFILLKLIKQEVISHFIHQESLTSYHCKTCIFYIIEHTPAEFWQPENLLICFLACMTLLLQWTQERLCPNYFIPEENMFDRHVHGRLRQNLSKLLQHLLSADLMYLIHISSDLLGHRLLQAYSPSSAFMGSQTPSEALDKIVISSGSKKPCRFICHMVNQQKCDDIEAVVNQLYSAVWKLQRITRVAEHTVEDIQRATAMMLPYLELCLVSNIVARAFHQCQSKTTIWKYLTSCKWRDLSNSLPLITKLKQASFLYSFGSYEVSVYILSTITNHTTFPFCGCYDKTFRMPPLKIHVQTLHNIKQVLKDNPSISVEQLESMFVTPCVMFLPTERDVTPPPLRYEMLRSVGMPPDSRDDSKYFWYDWAVIDANILLHLLLYLNHQKLHVDVAADIENMKTLINALHVRHRETALNVLGWVYKDEGNIDEAKECFKKSLNILPEHNAALLHMKDLEQLFK